MNILGLSFFYHDSAACLLVNGVPVAMSEEERFSRKKHDAGYPELAIQFVLRESGLSAKDLDAVVFYEKPFWKLDRLMKSALATFPLAPVAFAESVKSLFTSKLWIRHLISSKLDVPPEKIHFSGHHLSHMVSSFFSCPWEKAAILTVDGVGEWATTALAIGEGNTIRVLKEIRYPHSLGLLYSAFTAFLGFEVNEGEYKVMGMAPYGRPLYADRVRKLLTMYPDGSYALNLEYFTFQRSIKRTYSKKFVELFGAPRDPKSHFFTRTTGWPSYFGEKPTGEAFDKLAESQEYYADIAASVQAVTEEVLIGLARALHRETGVDKLCFAGGVALNSVANWKLIQNTPFTEMFIQPAAGDAGGALGAALAYEFLGTDAKRPFIPPHAFYGASYTTEEITKTLDAKGVRYEVVPSDAEVIERTAQALVDGKVVGWYRGRFEWGPRALGSRSILADPRRADMKDIVNTKIKFREPYRPFAPSVLQEKAGEWFDLPNAERHYPARFMLYVVQVNADKRERIPAITHVDGSARPQLVVREDAPAYYRLIERFYEKTGVPLVLDTSFNLKGEPIVNTPENALNTYAKSEMDMLVMENVIVRRADLPAGMGQRSEPLVRQGAS
jgi:carbamoyltransferase